MKASKYILFVVMVLHAATSFAQQIPRQSLEDKVLGWMKVYNFTGIRPPITVDAKHYSAAQLAIGDSFVNWIQASYVPKGALGDVVRTVSTKLGLYNQDDAALPQTYGAAAKTYFQLKYDSSGKIVLYDASHLTWSITANGVIGEPLMALNTPTQYYFLIPNFARPAPPPEPGMERYDLSNHPALKPYITYFNNAMTSINVGATNVVLSKDNKLPFIEITKGEYLDKLAGAIDRKYAKDKAAAIQGWPEGNARASVLRDADTKYQKRLSVLNSNRGKYGSLLQTTAEVSTLQPNELLENQADVFEGNGGSRDRYPVYKIDPAMAELAKTDKPQWIVVYWEGDLLDPVGKQLADAIINNFNFGYVYDFFFDPEKVKGQPYKPLRSPDYKETVVVTPASATAKLNTSDPAVHFFEDFSTTGVGQRPSGWSFGLNVSVIANLDGLPGNWAVMAGDAKLTPKLLKTPLPQDFTLSYELVAVQNFTWGAKGLTIQLANEKPAGNPVSYLRLKLRPGFDGKDGEATIETQFPAGYLSGYKYLPATGFSNNKTNNRIAVSIRKTGETLQVFIDKNKIAEYEKAIPSGLLFNAVSFFVPGSPSELKDKFFVSSIKIAKE